MAPAKKRIFPEQRRSARIVSHTSNPGKEVFLSLSLPQPAIFFVLNPLSKLALPDAPLTADFKSRHLFLLDHPHKGPFRNLKDLGCGFQGQKSEFFLSIVHKLTHPCLFKLAISMP